MGGEGARKGMDADKVRAIADRLSHAQRNIADAAVKADTAVRALRPVWTGDDAKTFFNGWPALRESIESGALQVEDLQKRLREELGDQEQTSGVRGGGDADGDGTPDRRDRDDDNDGTPDTQDTDDDNDGTPDPADSDPNVPDNHDDTPEDDDDADGDGADDDSDEDDDNDGIPDTLDARDDNDDDHDGVPNSDDVDDDNDGVNDSDEEGRHRDGSGIWDRGGFDKTPQVDAGMTLVEGEKELLDKEWIHLGGDEDDPTHAVLEVGSVDSKAEYEAGITKDGLVAGAGFTAGAYAFNGSAQWTGSHGTQLGAKGYVGAEANADAGVTLGTNGIAANAGFDAFAGGKAEGSFNQDLGPMDVGAGVEVSYGVGVHAEADASFTSDNIGVSVDLGATLGIGGGVSFDIGFDPPW